MPAQRRSISGDTRAAKTQLRTADASARVGKDTRAKTDPSSKNLITVPLIIKRKGEEPVEREFMLAEHVGIMPLMEWAASSDSEVNGIEGLRAVYHVLQDTVHEDEWDEFRKFCRENKGEARDLLDFANSALEALAGRPTEESDGS